MTCVEMAYGSYVLWDLHGMAHRLLSARLQQESFGLILPLDRVKRLLTITNAYPQWPGTHNEMEAGAAYHNVEHKPEMTHCILNIKLAMNSRAGLKKVIALSISFSHPQVIYNMQFKIMTSLMGLLRAFLK